MSDDKEQRQRIVAAARSAVVAQVDIGREAALLEIIDQLEREIAEAKEAVNVAMQNHADAENRAARPSLREVGEPTPEMVEAGRLAIMGMLEPKRTPKPKPTLDELEAMLNSESPPDIHIAPDGSYEQLSPRTTTASEVAKAAYTAMVALAPSPLGESIAAPFEKWQVWMDATRAWWRSWSTTEQAACNQAQVADMMREAFEAGYNTALGDTKK